MAVAAAEAGLEELESLVGGEAVGVVVAVVGCVVEPRLLWSLTGMLASSLPVARRMLL